MRLRFIGKPRRQEPKPTVSEEIPKPVPPKTKDAGKTKNNTKENKKNMNIDEIEELASELTPEQTTKRIKKDKSLIERTESSKIMITEDNKQLLQD